MRKNRTIELMAPLLKKPYFTSREARKIDVSAAMLSYYVKKGLIERIGRGLYRGANAPAIQDFRWEDLIQCLAKVKDGVICHISALAIYGLTDEIPRQHWIAIRHDTRHNADANVKIIRMRNLALGRTTIDIDGITISIFDRERTIVDAFKYLSKETAIKALQEAAKKKGDERIELEKIHLYAKKLRCNIKPYLLMVST